MQRKTREPVKSPLVWLVFVLIFILLNPWYFPTGSYAPLFWGVPYWAWIMIGASLAMSLFVTWVVYRQWDMDADKEYPPREE